MNEYRFLEHPSDIAIEVKADSLERLFETAADAWKESVIESSSLESPFEFEIFLEGNTPEELLVEFLSEINYFLYSKKLFFSRLKYLSIEENITFKAKAVIYFEDFNPSWHQLKAEIKAVTFHQMKIEKINGIYSTKIIFDI